MENPCDICLVKVNCTQVCPAKENFKALLKNATKYYKHDGMVRFRNEQDRKNYNKHLHMLIKTENEMSTIKCRKMSIENSW